MNIFNQILDDKTLQNILAKWRKMEDPKLGFNVFALMSNLYYRENFHSDMLAALLKEDGDHGEGNLFFHLFVQALNGIAGRTIIDISDFSNYTVEREKGKIDILIADSVSKRAIIIENKINNAVDMNRQIPRYHDLCVKDYGLDVAAIVYWRLDRHKTPWTGDWTEGEIETLKPKIIYLNTVSEKGKNLVNSVLEPILLKSNHVDVATVLKQYITLLKYLDGTKQTYCIMNEFYDFAISGNHFKSLVELKQMVEQIPAFLADKISERYKELCAPFAEAWVWEDTTAVLENYMYKGGNHCIDVYCSLDEFQFKFFSRNPGENYTEEILGKMQLTFDEKSTDGRYIVHFDNPDMATREEELFAYMDDFLDKLKKIEQ